MIGRTLQPYQLMAILLEPFLERIDEPRFADAGLSDHEYRLALAALCEFPALEQHANFAAPADKLRKGVARAASKRLSTSRSPRTANTGMSESLSTPARRELRSRKIGPRGAACCQQ